MRDGRGRRAACYLYRGNRKRPHIKLPKWARRKWVVCHEAAHAIVRHDKEGVPAHGAYFMRVYIDLLVQHCGHDLNALEGSAKIAGIKVMQLEEELLAA